MPKAESRENEEQMDIGDGYRWVGQPRPIVGAVPSKQCQHAVRVCWLQSAV